MAGTRNGGRQAAATNKMRYGTAFYETIGRLGGKKSRGGGFAKNNDLAREARPPLWPARRARSLFLAKPPPRLFLPPSRPMVS